MHNQATSDVLAHIASNVRALRRQTGLSQQALADAAGLSRRMVVALESGDANISLGKLSLLAAALGVRFAELVRMPGEDAGECRGTLAWRGRGERSQAHLMGAVPASREVELWIWSLEPGERYAAEPDPPGFHEMIHVFEGTLAIEFAAGSRTLAAGESLTFDSARPYAYFNPGVTLVRFVRNVVA
jgi:transcriptional regulator with XRE-family HTH domain